MLQYHSVSACRRFFVILIAGVFASLFWYFLQRRISLLSISKTKQLVGKRSPNFLGQTLHALVQVAIVGAGASVGKEGAPRELGALCAGSLSKGLGLEISERQLMIACGAGAGLAAVYQVPFVCFGNSRSWMETKKYSRHSFLNLPIGLLRPTNCWW